VRRRKQPVRRLNSTAGVTTTIPEQRKLTQGIVPFEEDEKDPSVWFLDHNYVESMNDMFKKVNAREKLIGWYHTGPKLRASDLEVNELFKRYTPNPLLVIIDVQPKEVGVPTDAYFAVEEIKDVSLQVCMAIRLYTDSTPGRHNNLQDLRPHPLDNRSRRSRGDRC
jgi:proteasome lid subunit RPN8/RPN11